MLNSKREEFISKSIAVHGNKYDYSKVVYIGALTKVTIVCPIHGNFQILPHNHLHGSGCPDCGILKAKEKLTKTNEEFIDDCKRILGNGYSFEKTKYVCSKTKVVITCKIHGDFYKFPTQIHSGNLFCPKCNKERLQIARKQKFIEQSSKIHNNKYSYEKVIYKNNSTKVEIICPKHGSFFMKPNSHLLGCGCKKCWEEKRGKYLLSNTKEFIEKAKKTHGDLYNYDLVDYKSENIPVKIICPIHGIFEQQPHSHLAGSGCPICKNSKGELRIRSFLKNNNIEFVQQKRIKNDLLFCDTKTFVVDFFLSCYNTIIEFHGEQHYKLIKHFGGTKKFEKQKNRDIFLRMYCKHHKIRLIEIPYTDIENIEKILTKKLKLKKK